MSSSLPHQPSKPFVPFDVLPRNAGKRKSHAGIFATIGEEKIRGGSPQSVGRMLLRMHLAELAQNRIERI
jgi:hypothetical protein